jgi:hypothetical protein
MFESVFKKVGRVNLPKFSGIRVMMLPVICGDDKSLPSFVKDYGVVFGDLAAMANPEHIGEVVYLTVDEKCVMPTKTHRRAGLHVDGGSGRGWGGGGGWGSIETGMLTVSSHPGCRAWSQSFNGEVGEEGSCDHLRDELVGDGTLLAPGEVYWLGGLCVHESVSQESAVDRQFVRLSLPSECPWYEGYTENPLGVKPTGPILQRRVFMDEAA